jgi:hypothetical protein
MENIKNNSARQFFSKIDYGFLPPSTLIDILRKEDSPKTHPCNQRNTKKAPTAKAIDAKCFQGYLWS